MIFKVNSNYESGCWSDRGHWLSGNWKDDYSWSFSWHNSDSKSGLRDLYPWGFY